MEKRIAVIGAGPAGQFAVEELILRGVDPKAITVFDQGPRLNQRGCPTQLSSCTCPVCSVLEGEGGAGGVSDGKMTYSTRRGTQGLRVFSDAEYAEVIERIRGRMEEIETDLGLRSHREDRDEIVQNWRGTGLAFEAYPLVHYGSDGIQRIVREQTRDMEASGITYRFRTRVIAISRAASGYSLLLPNGWETFHVVIVATGLAGTGWSEQTLRSLGAELSPGEAGFGLRVEAPAEVLDPAFDAFYDFKLTSSGSPWVTRSFCCNRRGYVTNENHRSLGFTNVNGHSLLGTQSQFSNFAVITRVPVEHPGDDPSAYVRALARLINDVARGTAVQSLEGFLAIRKGVGEPKGTNPKATPTDLRGILPVVPWFNISSFVQRVCTALPGLADGGMIYGPEVKYYGYRVGVTDAWEVKGLPGLFVIGNASGFLDSHVACAASGVIAARAIAQTL